MNKTKKTTCTYSEFISLITEIEEDSFFEITGPFEALSDEQLAILNLPEEKLQVYYDSDKSSLDQIALLLSGVPEGIKVELNLQNLESQVSVIFAFYNINALKGIIIPKTIKRIWAGSFCDCKNLEYVVIPKGQCKLISEGAFKRCMHLNLLKIECELEKAEANIFKDCRTKITVDYQDKEKDANYYHLYPNEFDYKSFCIETPRLILKPLTEMDYESTAQYLFDPRNLEFEEISDLDEETRLAKRLQTAESHWSNPDFTYCDFQICIKENGENIGHIPLYDFVPENDDDDALVEQEGYMIGWTLAFEYHNKGYTTEAARAVVDWAKSFLKVKRIWAYAVKENKASIHVMEKLGMKFEKEFSVVEKDGQKRVKVIYALNL
jgi:RimJ/RimL family protein N-acetyltransferase